MCFPYTFKALFWMVPMFDDFAPSFFSPSASGSSLPSPSDLKSNNFHPSLQPIYVHNSETYGPHLEFQNIYHMTEVRNLKAKFANYATNYEFEEFFQHHTQPILKEQWNASIEN